jgi:hypothetical protein
MWAFIRSFIAVPGLAFSPADVIGMPTQNKTG